MSKIIKTKKELDLCLKVIPYISGKINMDGLSLIAELLKVNIEDLRRVHFVHHYRINNGILGNPYKNNENLYQLWEIYVEKRKELQPKINKYFQFEKHKGVFNDVSNEEGKRPKLDKIPDIFPECLNEIKNLNNEISPELN